MQLFPNFYGSLLILFLLWLPHPPSTSAPIRLIPDLPIMIPIQETHPSELLYRSSGQEWIEVSARSVGDQPIDTVLTVQSPSLDKLAYNDDTMRITDDSISIQTDAHIQGLWLAEAGDYRILVDSFNGAMEGTVEISLIVNSLDTVPAFDDAMLIQANLFAHTNYQISFSDSTSKNYVVSVRDVSDTLDPFLIIRDADGIILARNDDHATNDLTLNTWDAKISDWSTTAETTYILEIGDVLGRAGSFELEIVQGDA